MPEILTKEDLDNLQCEHCNNKDEAVYFHSECHPRSPTWVSYLNGILRIECAECEERILAIKVQGGEAFQT